MSVETEVTLGCWNLAGWVVSIKKLIFEISIYLGIGKPLSIYLLFSQHYVLYRWVCETICFTQRYKTYFKVQLNLHETDLLFRYLSHHLTWHCLLIYCFSPFLPVLVCCDHKIVLHWYENQNKNNLVIMLRKSSLILGNRQKSTNNFMSNSG